MKKVINKIVIGVAFVAFLSILNTNNCIVTESKSFNANNIKDSTVSTRELALLASTVYEDVPDDSRYEGKTANKGCIKNGQLVEGCYYTALENKTDSSVKLKKSIYNHVYQYVEGLSKRKVNSFVGQLTSSFVENGQSYYFLTFSQVEEMEKKGWTIYDYEQKILKFPNDAAHENHFDDQFYAVTFKKGNNYVIAYRGTDYPDLLEWLADIAYSLNGKHVQAESAYNYAQEVYKKIESSTDKFNIYVTGHSLGAYLAQIGGAAIVDYEAGIEEKPNKRIAKKYESIDKYTEDYAKGKAIDSRLVQVAYFNGMGVNSMFLPSQMYSLNISNALVYLSTHDSEGKVIKNGRNVNYSDRVKSSGRLVLYSMDADPVSDIGLHFGEIYKLDVAADAITNHHGTHVNLSGAILGTSLQGLTRLIAQADKYANYTERVSDYIKNNWNDLISELNAAYDNKFVDSLSQNLSLLVGTDGIQKIDWGYIPDFVQKDISVTNNFLGTEYLNYSLISLLNNLSRDVEEFANKYKDQHIKIYNIFDHFNMNHETDSFACLIDSDNNGVITKDSITINARANSNSNMHCSNQECYTNKPYVSNVGSSNYELGANVSEAYGNNIILKTEVVGGCAHSYTWYYSYDKDGKYTELGTTIRNEIIIPANYVRTKLNAVKNKEKLSIYFKVKVEFGNSYTESKLRTGIGLLEYIDGDSSKQNPTLADNVNVGSREVYESNPYVLNIYYDTQSPNCRFVSEDNKTITSKTITINKSFLGIATPAVRSEIILKCDDNLSGLNPAVRFNLDRNIHFGLPIVNLYWVPDKLTGYNYIKVEAVRTSSSNARLSVKDITDRAGNKISEKSINIYAKKKKNDENKESWFSWLWPWNS